MRVGVVGAGITGLTLSHALAERGVDSITFEASDEPGGVIRSRRVDGRLLEFGPQRVRLTPPLADLVDGLPLDDEVVRADPSLPLYVYVDGRLRRVPFGLRAFLRTDLLTGPEKLRLLAEPLTSTGSPEETAADYLARKFGTGAYEKMIGPLFGGIFGSDPGRMPVRYSLSGLLDAERRWGSLLAAGIARLRRRDRPPAASFEAGLQRLPEALYTATADRVHLDTPVTGIVPVDDGYRVETPGDETAVDHVVVTTPAPTAAELLAEVGEGADRLGDLTYNPLAMVHLSADLDRRAMGYQVRRDEGLETLGVTWNASLFDREGTYTAFLGGMWNPRLLEASDERLGSVAAEEFEAVTGSPAEPVAVTRHPAGFPAHDTTWTALDDLHLPAGVHLATNYTGRMGIGGRVREAQELAESLAATA